MSRRLKNVILGVTALLIVLCAAVLLVRTQITPERVQQALIPQLENVLERPVSLAQVEVGLLTGIRIAGLRVGQQAADGVLLAIEALELRYRFWPLLSGRLVIDRILLSGPRLHLQRDAAGRLNIADLQKRLTRPGKPFSGQREAQQDSAPVLPLRLLVRSLRLEEGRIVFQDHLANPRTPYRYTLSDMTLEARELTLQDSFPIDVSLRINGTRLDASGHYDLRARTGDLLVHLDALDLIPFAPYYRELLPGRLRRGALAAKFEVDFAPGKVHSKGRLELQQGDLLLSVPPDTAFSDLALAVDYAVTYESERRRLQFSTLMVDYNGLRAGAELDVDLASPDPFLVGLVKLSELDLRRLSQLLPASLKRPYEQFSPAGHLSAQFDLRGRLSSASGLIERVVIQLADVRISNDEIRAGLSGDLHYAAEMLQSEHLTLEYAGQQAVLQLHLENPFHRPLRGQFTLSAGTLDLDAVLPANEISGKADAEKSRAGQTQPVSLADDLGPWRLPVALTGRIALERLITQQLTLTEVEANVHVADQRLRIESLNAQLAGGELRGQGVVQFDRPGLAYQGQLTGRGIQLGELFTGSRRSRLAQPAGELNGRMLFSGKGVRRVNLRRYLTMEGDVSLHRGRLHDLALVKEIGAFLGSRALNILEFDELTCSYRLADGQLRVAGNVRGGPLEFSPQGRIGLDGRLDLRSQVRVSPELMNGVAGGHRFRSLFAGEQGWSVIPLQISGTLQEPQIGFDEDALRATARKTAADHLSRKPDNGSPPLDAPPAAPIRQMLDKTLDRLFNR